MPSAAGSYTQLLELNKDRAVAQVYIVCEAA